MRTTPNTVMMLGLAATAVLVSRSPAQAQAWPIKEFQVVAVEPAGVVEGNRNIHGWVEEMVRIIRTETNYDPDFPPIWDEPTVALPEDVRTEIETVLREAARKLESWGFPPPALEPVVSTEGGANAYRVYLVTGRRGIAGAYHGRPCQFGVREAVIVLDANDVIQNGLLLTYGAKVAIHELVHAVQASLRPWSCSVGSPGQWVGEGTADAIAWDIVGRHLRGLQSFRGYRDPAWGAREYSEPLPVPGATGTTRAYRSSSFWRYLAEYHGSRPTLPGPGATWPVDYSYLTPLLGRDFGPRDCYDHGDPCDAELRWLDAGLRGQLGLPLRDVYARFMQVYAQYGEERVRSVEGGGEVTQRRNWLARSFAHEGGSGCAEVVLRPDDERRQQVDVVARFPDVATRCWEIDIDGFQDTVTLAATVSYRPGTEAVLEQLTAVMADASGRVDRAAVRTIAGVPQATWYYRRSGMNDTPLFLLTNVADNPDATRGLANLSITFTALDHYVRMGVSGGGSGDGGEPSGPTPAEIDRPTPIDFEVADGSVTVFYEPPICLTWFMLDSRRDDALWVIGKLTPPITPGTYPIQPADGIDVLGGRLYSPRYNWGGAPLSAQSGTLVIEYVHHLMIAGSVETHLGGGGGPTADVHAEFALQPGSMVSGILGAKPPDHPCFAPVEAANAADTEQGTGGGSPDSGDPDDHDDSRGPGEPGTPDDAGNPEDSGVSGTANESGSPEPPGDPEAGPGVGDGAADPENPAPRAGPGSGGELSGPNLTLDFLEDGESSLRSAPQAVSGRGSGAGVTVSSSAFSVELAVPAEALMSCATHLRDPTAFLELLAMGQSRNGRFHLEITGGSLELGATTGDVQIAFTHDFGAIRVLGAAPATVELAPAGPNAMRGDISGGTLEVAFAGDRFSCSDLMSVSFVVAQPN